MPPGRVDPDEDRAVPAEARDPPDAAAAPTGSPAAVVLVVREPDRREVVAAPGRMTPLAWPRFRPEERPPADAAPAMAAAAAGVNRAPRSPRDSSR